MKRVRLASQNTPLHAFKVHTTAIHVPYRCVNLGTYLRGWDVSFTVHHPRDRIVCFADKYCELESRGM